MNVSKILNCQIQYIPVYRYKKVKDVHHRNTKRLTVQGDLKFIMINVYKYKQVYQLH